MATPALSLQVQSAVSEYGIFWQLWPQFEQMGSERRLAGLEVELIGSHPSDVNHLDPSCRMCHHVRLVLLGIAYLMTKEIVGDGNPLTYDVDSHSNSILCLPALGNRSAVSVSAHFSWSHSTGQALETRLQSEIKMFLAKRGIHQR